MARWIELHNCFYRLRIEVDNHTIPDFGANQIDDDECAIFAWLLHFSFEHKPVLSGVFGDSKRRVSGCRYVLLSRSGIWTNDCRSLDVFSKPG